MDLADLDPDPVVQFCRWKDELSPHDDAVTLATAGADGVPDARIVLVKGAQETGFVFFTNRGSAKGRELAGNPRAALVFSWPPRSVRVAGSVEEVGEAESDAYWATRPRGSQLGAWASPQSQVLPDRAAVEAGLAAAVERFGTEGPVPPPPHWGGLRVIPETVEFWQGRGNRLHDRLRFRRTATGWIVERLAP